MTRPTCTIDGCGRRLRARGLCGTHYQRWERHGDALAHVPVRDVRSTVTLDAQPLIDRMRARGAPASLDSPSDRRAFHRAEQTGAIGDLTADRFACHYLHLPLELIYGLDWGRDQEAA